MTRATTSVTRGPLAVMLGVAAGCWAAAIWQMHGMDMGAASALGSLGSFIGVWVPMMAAMMLPGAVPAVLRVAHGGAGPVRAAMFLSAYLAVWSLGGLVMYALYRPHGAPVAAGVVLAAGLYELTPVKRYFRRRCQESLDSGVGFGAYCVGSSIGLMAVMAAVGVMSVIWMAVIAVLVLGQKLAGASAAVDVPLALAIIAFAAVIIVAPSTVPGLTPAM
ncbi:MAG: DUF2182 domain-containing protein [Acidobacteriota bacterium]|nr:DUF2182 domain-containing protein [Acidobacteriota bacterium]